MNMPWLFFIAVGCMTVGHIFKVKRWRLLISVYEEPLISNLLNAIAFGHMINAVLPFRAGDAVRICWAGRKLKNGYSFSFATVAADLYADVITVGAMFFCLALIGKGGDKLLQTAYFYMWAFIVLIPLTWFCIIFRKALKRAISAVSGVFNERIEFRLLYISYLCIASLKDMVNHIHKPKFAIYTFSIWSGYILSYVMFAEAIQKSGFNYAASDIFTELFSGASLYHIDKEAVFLWMAYLLLPLAICWIISMIKVKGNLERENIFRSTLPQMNRADRRAFLKTYYEEENRNHVQAYLEINKDVMVAEDKSAGSNASTVLVMKPDGSLLYRKYAFDADGRKLQEQIDWIEQHQEDIPLPVIVEKRSGDNFVTYDMHCYMSTVGLFRYIHTMTIEDSWRVMKKALDEIRGGLHTKNIRQAGKENIRNYIDKKVTKNICIISEQNKYIKNLETYEVIQVNGYTLRPLKFYFEMLKPEHLMNIFKNDRYADIHGDLTIENIVCLFDEKEVNVDEYRGKAKPESYYFIDPNTGNLHDSPYLDYGKILQSLHGNYEFLMMVNSVKIEKNQVSYMMTKSEAYGQLYDQYKMYLCEKFDSREVLSIYYHEIVHWLRLMPYKISKDEKLAVVFYTGLLGVLNDVWEMENGKKG